MGDVGQLFVEDGTVEDDEVARRVDEAALGLREVAYFGGRTPQQAVNIQRHFTYIHFKSLAAPPPNTQLAPHLTTMSIASAYRPAKAVLKPRQCLSDRQPL